MHVHKPITICFALVVSVATACTSGSQPESGGVRPEVTSQAHAVPSATELTPEIIAQLQQEYRVLRSEPAPEPQPNGDARPEDVPERLRGVLPESALQAVTGNATFYADKFEGQRTASGIPFRQHQMVAAHRAFPFGTLLRVTNLSNDRFVNVRVVDRGPFANPRGVERPIIDLSRRAAEQLGYVGAGRTRVRVEVLEWGKGVPNVT